MRSVDLETGGDVVSIVWDRKSDEVIRIAVASRDGSIQAFAFDKFNTLFTTFDVKLGKCSPLAMCLPDDQSRINIISHSIDFSFEGLM